MRDHDNYVVFDTHILLQPQDQLVKYKDTREYLQLYIPKDHEEYIH